MRPHHVLTRLIETVSSGCAARSSGPAANAATTGPAIRPAPSPATQGTGARASRAMKTAPPSATAATTSMPPTHAAVAVERAIISASSRTRTADQAMAPVIEARVRPHIRPGTRASWNLGLGDADCISRPHQSREVVAAADDVEIDVLSEIEARVLVRAAKTRYVEIEDDHRRAAPAHRLQQANPLWIGAWRDDSNGTPREPADPIPGEGLGQRGSSIRLRDSEVVEDQPVLPDGAVGLQDGAPGVVGDQADLASAAVDLRCHRRREADRILDSRLLAFPEVHAPVEVQEDPEVRRKGLLERLRHEPRMTCGQPPVNPAEAVAGSVVANAAGLRGVVGPRSERLRIPDLQGARRHEVRNRPHPRVHEDRGALTELQLSVE